jgi:hypothetical protein
MRLIRREEGERKEVLGCSVLGQCLGRLESSRPTTDPPIHWQNQFFDEVRVKTLSRGRKCEMQQTPTIVNKWKKQGWDRRYALLGWCIRYVPSEGCFSNWLDSENLCRTEPLPFIINMTFSYNIISEHASIYMCLSLRMCQVQSWGWVESCSVSICLHKIK